MLQERELAAATGVGRHVFIKGLAATGALVGARLEVDPRRVEEPAPGLLVVPFRGHGFAREDFVGDAELHVEDDRVAKVVFRAP